MHFYENMQAYLNGQSADKHLVRYNYDDKEDMFDLVSYNKGGAVLHILRKYLGDEERMQIIEPTSVMDDLLKTILTVQKYVTAGILVVGLSTVMTAVLVFMLSLRLRERELVTMHRIGGSRSSILALLGAEIIVVLVAGVVLAGMLTVVVSQMGEQLIRLFIL